MQIKDVVAQDDGILAFEDETRMTYQADVGHLIKRQNGKYESLQDYDYFCNFEIDFDGECLVWAEGEKMSFQIIENYSEREFCLCSLKHIYRRLSSSELDERLEEFADIIVDTLPGSKIFYHGDYLDGIPDKFSTVDFLVVCNRNFECDFVRSRLQLFLANLYEEGYRVFCTLKLLNRDFEEDPEHQDDAQILKRAKRIR